MFRRLAKKVLGRVGSPAASEPPAPVADAVSLSRMTADAQEVYERVEAGEPVVLLDVREPDETANGVIAGARLIPLSQLDARWEEVKDCDEIVCYAAGTPRSLKAARTLRQNGVFNATSLDGGLEAWASAGGRLTTSG